MGLEKLIRFNRRRAITRFESFHMDITETRQCSACKATISLTALPYCWRCRAPFGPSGPDSTERKTTRTLQAAALWLFGIAVIAATIWWAIQ